MRAILDAIKYLFRNFLAIGLFALPIAVGFALKFSDSSFFEYLINLSSMENAALVEIYASFSMLPFYDVLMTLLWLAVAMLTFCLILSYMERHMKYGVRSFFKSFKSINFTVLTVFPAFVVVLGIEELFAFFGALFVNLFSLSPSPLISVILPLVYLVMYFIMFMVFSLLALWLPVRMVTGYTNRDAIRYSIRLSQGRQFRIVLGLMFPLLVTSPFMLLIHQLSDIQWLNIIFFTLCYVFIVGYILSYTMTLYFSVTGTERKDIKKQLFRKVPYGRRPGNRV